MKKVTTCGSRLTLALNAMGGMKATLPIARLFINNPETVKTWMDVGGRILRERIETWCRTGQSVPLFQEISNLVMTVLIHVVMGDEFAEKYAAELVPLMQGYEIALQTLEFKALPLWASKVGWTMESTERRISDLLRNELEIRLKNPNLYKERAGYFQEIIKSGQHEGIYSENSLK